MGLAGPAWQSSGPIGAGTVFCGSLSAARLEWGLHLATGILVTGQERLAQPTWVRWSSTAVVPSTVPVAGLRACAFAYEQAGARAPCFSAWLIAREHAARFVRGCCKGHGTWRAGA